MKAELEIRTLLPWLPPEKGNYMSMHVIAYVI
jgi:hypothetical protein